MLFCGKQFVKEVSYDSYNISFSCFDSGKYLQGGRVIKCFTYGHNLLKTKRRSFYYGSVKPDFLS